MLFLPVKVFHTRLEDVKVESVAPLEDLELLEAQRFCNP